MTQEEPAKETGVSLRTIISLEQGKNISFSNIISVLRVLRLIENLELLISKEKTDPFTILELGKKRQRVSKAAKKSKSIWKWGDER